MLKIDDRTPAFWSPMGGPHRSIIFLQASNEQINQRMAGIANA